MSQIEVTSRMHEVLLKWIHMVCKLYGQSSSTFTNFVKLAESSIEIDCTDYNQTIYFRAYLNRSTESADDDEDDDDQISYYYYFEISYNHHHRSSTVIKSFNFPIDGDLKVLYESLDSLKGTIYKLCVCGQLTCIDGRCRTCYLYSYIRGEPCAICLEDDYSWIKLGCGHVIHSHCYGSLQASLDSVDYYRPCPLCRTQIDRTKCTSNPYNI